MSRKAIILGGVGFVVLATVVGLLVYFLAFRREECDKGFIYNEETGECEAIVCKTGEVLDVNTGECVAKVCEPGQKIDGTTGECVAIECARNMTLNTDTNECECNDGHLPSPFEGGGCMTKPPTVFNVKTTHDSSDSPYCWEKAPATEQKNVIFVDPCIEKGKTGDWRQKFSFNHVNNTLRYAPGSNLCLRVNKGERPVVNHDNEIYLDKCEDADKFYHDPKTNEWRSVEDPSKCVVAVKTVGARRYLVLQDCMEGPGSEYTVEEY